MAQLVGIAGQIVDQAEKAAKEGLTREQFFADFSSRVLTSHDPEAEFAAEIAQAEQSPSWPYS